MPDVPSERLTTTAARLFQQKGFARVGINEIVREANVARMSLYNNFRSKEELAVAAYASLSEARQNAIDEVIATATTPDAAILAIFDLAEDLASKQSFRGCAFVNLAAHIGAEDERLMSLVRRHKGAIRQRFVDLTSRNGAPDPDRLSRQLLALWDGGLVSAFIEDDLAPIAAARAAAASLIGQPDR